MPSATADAPVVPSSRLRTTRRSTTDYSTRHRSRAGAPPLNRNRRDESEDEVSHLLDVRGEEALDVVDRHRLDVRAALDACVVIGDERDVEVAHLQLTRQDDLGILGHVYDVPTHRREPLALGAGREARPLNDD